MGGLVFAINSERTTFMTFSATESLHSIPDFHQSEMEKVLAELKHLKRQSERLELINNLHGRIAGLLNLSGMIEAYSVWLTPLVSHELIGYNNSTRQKKHFFCSSHGPDRRDAIAFAERLIDETPKIQNCCTEENGRYAYKWIFETAEDSGILLILKHGHKLTDSEFELINQSLDVLAECLRRGLEYEDLFERASNDPLTGLHNRRVFEDRIHVMMESAQRYNKPLSMIAMDLDNFKAINDNLGHIKGDEVLKKVAQMFKNSVRSTDLLARVGGDEFLLVLDNTELNYARMLAERLCASVDGLNLYASETQKLGVSIGLSEMKDKETIEEWLERTDDILYHAKYLGKSRVAVE